MLCENPDGTELVSMLTHMCNAEWVGSFAATVVSEVHVRPWGISVSIPHRDPEDWTSTLCIEKDGKLFHP
jgi:hypothetical protein